ASFERLSLGKWIWESTKAVMPARCWSRMSRGVIQPPGYDVCWWPTPAQGVFVGLSAAGESGRCIPAHPLVNRPKLDSGQAKESAKRAFRAMSSAGRRLMEQRGIEPHQLSPNEISGLE